MTPLILLQRWASAAVADVLMLDGTPALYHGPQVDVTIKKETQS